LPFRLDDSRSCLLYRETNFGQSGRQRRTNLKFACPFLFGDLQDIVRAVKTKGAALKATEQPIDTGTAAGKAFLDMLGVFADSKPTYAKSDSSKESPKPRRPASTRAAQHP
jgi:hypothetical protein